MSKIIIFGIGKVLHDYINEVDLEEVVCFADNNARLSMSFYERLIIRPERIKEYKYDFVVIFNKKNIYEIYDQLIQLKIPKYKILSWVFYLFILKRKVSKLSFDCFNFLKNCIYELDIRNILDVNNSMMKNGFYVRYQNIFQYISIVDNYNKNSESSRKTYYHDIVTKETIKQQYDALICLDFFMEHSLEEWNNLYKELASYIRYLIFSIPYPCPEKYSAWSSINFNKYVKYKEINLSLVKLIIIDTHDISVSDDIAIYTVTHKNFKPPQDPLYHPVFAGKTDDNEMGIIGDGTGDSISYLNPVLNECTALYWIWKHSEYSIIGLNHYRRYFRIGYFWNDPVQDMLDEIYVRRYLEDYDLIVAESYDTFPYSLKQHIRFSVNADIFDEYYEKIREAVSIKYPGYLQDFDIYFSSYYTNKCHMFVARKEIIDKYCKWFFDIVLDVAREMPVSKYDSMTQRTVGYIAERMFTLWIMHNNLRMKELPVLDL